MENPNALRRLVAPLALTGALYMGAVACSESESSLPPEGAPAATTETTLNPGQQAELGELCVNGFNMDPSLNEEFDLGNVGGADSLMNNFTEVNEEGETVPVAPEIFADKLLNEVCQKPEVLATITAFMIEPAGLVNGKVSAPDASSLNRAKELAELYRSNDVAALDAIRTVASVVKAQNGVELVDDFAVIENQGTRIVPNRVEGEVLGLTTQQITVGDLFTGYLFNYLTDDTSLTKQQIKEREEVKTLVLIGQDGDFIIRVWIGDQQVDIEISDEAPETTVVATTIDESDTTIPVGEDEDDDESTPPTGTSIPEDDDDGNNGGGTGGGTGGGGCGTGCGGGGGGTGTSGPGTSGPGTSQPPSTPPTPTTEPKPKDPPATPTTAAPPEGY